MTPTTVKHSVTSVNDVMLTNTYTLRVEIASEESDKEGTVLIMKTLVQKNNFGDVNGAHAITFPSVQEFEMFTKVCEGVLAEWKKNKNGSG